MRTRVTVIASRDRGPRFDAVGGLAARLTAPDTVHLIGTAATPLGGDDICVTVRVLAGATLTVRSVAATVALPSAQTDVSTSSWHFEVEEGATLVFDPQPVIVAATAVHHSVTTVEMADSATVLVREQVQIGRSGERDGQWSGSLNATVNGRARLRHRLHLGDATPGSDVLFAPAALVSTLVIPGYDSTAVVDGSTVNGATVTLPLEGGGSLATWMGARLR